MKRAGMSILKRFHTGHLSPVIEAIKVCCVRIATSYVVLCCIMEKQTISFRLSTDKVAALNELAGILDRDRTHLLDEAVQAYLEAQRWQLQEIRKGIADADAGRAINHDRVRAMAGKWRRQK